MADCKSKKQPLDARLRPYLFPTASAKGPGAQMPKKQARLRAGGTNVGLTGSPSFFPSLFLSRSYFAFAALVATLPSCIVIDPSSPGRTLSLIVYLPLTISSALPTVAFPRGISSH